MGYGVVGCSAVECPVVEYNVLKSVLCGIVWCRAVPRVWFGVVGYGSV